MRIISGAYRHVRLRPPENLPVRPTTDKTKESVFNMLNSYFDFEELAVLDLFAGTGNMTFEFASRGCWYVLAVEQNLRAVRYIRETAKEHGMKRVKTMKADAFRFLERTTESFDIIFADPPYDLPQLGELPESVFNNDVLKPEGWFIMEHSRTHDFSGDDYFVEERHYGRTRVSVFKK